MSAHPVENLRPPLQSDALEDGQHGQYKVVKVGDPKVGTNPIFLADLAPGLVTEETPTAGSEMTRERE